jgi:hypothetical protein
MVGEPVTVGVWSHWGCVQRAAREVLPVLFAQSGGA